jgi:hypothetical protein
MRFEIWNDTDTESPREWDNLGTFQVYHRRYRSPDPIVRTTPYIDPKTEIGLKVWGYDHGGIIYATGDTNPFHCPWDSGFAGIIYAPKEHIYRWFGVKRITKKIRQQVLDTLKSEVEVYNQWITGEVYGFTIYDDEDNVIDSCGGFYGREHAEQEAQEYLK